KTTISLGVAAWAWEALKEGFVRHDQHDLIFFSLVLVALCLVRLPRAPLALQVGVIAIAAVLACLAAGGPPRPMRSPVEDVAALANEVRDLAWPGRWAGVERYARLQLLATGDALPPALVVSLRGRTVAAVPFEDALSFAYPGLRWRPEPVLQGYSAYTSYLDDADAAFLAGPRAPDLMLWLPGTIDGRDDIWDPPATVEAMYCHYRWLGASQAWSLLGRVPGRCGAPHLIGRTVARFGQVITVPRPPQPAEMVAADFSVSSPLSAEVAGLALKPPPLWVTVDGHRYRFIGGTARDLHVMSVPASLGYPSALQAVAYQQLSFAGGGWRPGHGSVRVTFYSISVTGG
ncbi:MAG TPA: hypothetical protein VK425_11260, partial [Acidimicrobiales bacterium]|nr:hypothetical protein [Acidimicrobiales bacterium]